MAKPLPMAAVVLPAASARARNARKRNQGSRQRPRSGRRRSPGCDLAQALIQGVSVPISRWPPPPPPHASPRPPCGQEEVGRLSPRASVRSRMSSPMPAISAMPPALSEMGPYASMARPARSATHARTHAKRRTQRRPPAAAARAAPFHGCRQVSALGECHPQSSRHPRAHTRAQRAQRAHAPQTHHNHDHQGACSHRWRACPARRKRPRQARIKHHNEGSALLSPVASVPSMPSAAVAMPYMPARLLPT